MSSDPDDKPEVIDLRRYRQAVEARAKAKAKPQARPAARPANSQSLLGGRRHAGLILAGFILAMLALWLLPKLL